MLGLLLALSLAGCVTTSIERTTQTIYPETRTQDVALFDREVDLPEGAEVIAVIYLPGPADIRDLSTQIDGIRSEAAKLGAHAIVVREFTDPITGEMFEYGLLGSARDFRGRALAVRLPN